MQSNVDIIVIGYELPGLIASSFLAKQGYRVLVIENGENEGTYECEGYLFARPKPLVPRLSGLPHAQYIHRQLGLEATMEKILDSSGRSFQLLSDDYRLDVWTNGDAFNLELEREFQEQKETLQSALERLFRVDAEINGLLAALPFLPADGWRQRREFKQYERQALKFSRDFLNNELEMVDDKVALGKSLRHLLRFFSRVDSNSPSVIHAVRAMCNFLRGTMGFVNADDSLEKYFADAAKNYGVEFVEQRVASLDVGYGKVRRIVTEQTEYSANVVLLNTQKNPISWITNKRALRKIEKDQNIASAHGAWALDIMLDASALPSHLGDVAFHLPSRQEEEVFMLRVSPALDQPSGENGEREANNFKVLSLSGWTPAEDLSAITPKARWELLAEQVECYAPFVSQHIACIASPIDILGEKGMAQETLYQFEAGTGTMGLGRTSLRSGLKNMLYCSGAVLPGLGMEGDYVCALAAVRSVLNMEQPRWKPLRDLAH